MKNKTISAIFLATALVACGPGKSGQSAPNSPAAAPIAVSTAPEYDSIGVIAALNGQLVTLDHEGESVAKLAAGRTAFQAYGDILAEAPLTPGERVTFKFRKAATGWDLADLKAR